MLLHFLNLSKIAAQIFYFAKPIFHTVICVSVARKPAFITLLSAYNSTHCTPTCTALNHYHIGECEIYVFNGDDKTYISHGLFTFSPTVTVLDHALMT